MQIHAQDGYKVGLATFTNMMVSSADGLVLPTLALYFLVFSVVRKEVDDHTLFLYRDIRRQHIFWAKYVGLLCMIVVFHGLLIATSALVHYLRVVHLPFGTPALFDFSLEEGLSTLFGIVSYLLKDIFSASLATLLALYTKQTTTMLVGFGVTTTMLITAVNGGFVAMLFPNGYMPLSYEGMTGTGLAFVSALGLTLVYAALFSRMAVKKFMKMEF